MKKVLATILSLVLIFTLVGCAESNRQNQSDKPSNPETTTPNSQTQTSNPTTDNNTSKNKEEKITADAAKKIALDHAKLKDTDIFDYDIDLDNENGVLVYEIDFEDKNFDYEYVINAKSGEIIYSEKEEDRRG